MSFQTTMLRWAKRVLLIIFTFTTDAGVVSVFFYFYFCATFRTFWNRTEPKIILTGRYRILYDNAFNFFCRTVRIKSNLKIKNILFTLPVRECRRVKKAQKDKRSEKTKSTYYSYLRFVNYHSIFYKINRYWRILSSTNTISTYCFFVNIKYHFHHLV